MNGRIIVALAMGFAVATPGAIAAQGRWPVSLEIYAGLGAGGSDAVYRHAAGLAADLLLGVRVGSAAGGGIVAAVSAGAQAPGPHTEECLIGPTGECIPTFPSFFIFSALGGWEKRSTNLRFLTGLAVVDGERDRRAVGWSARMEVFGSVVGPIGIGASLRGLLIPSYEGDSFHMMAITVGLRLR
jgi:hypothetical protein